MADRDSIFDYTAAESPKAAVMLDERIRRHVGQLIDFPYSGPPSRVSGMRELVVTRTPYIAVYRVDDDLVFILRIIHAARDWPDPL